MQNTFVTVLFLSIKLINLVILELKGIFHVLLKYNVLANIDL